MTRPKPLQAALLASPDDTEQQFYEALQRGNIEKLMSVWSDDDDIVCVHPGGPRMVGPMAIRAAFEAVFAHGGVDVHLEKVRRIASHGVSVHSVLERIRLRSNEAPHIAWVIATNVYVKGAQGWRLVTHHASPASAQELPELGGETPSTFH